MGNIYLINIDVYISQTKAWTHVKIKFVHLVEAMQYIYNILTRFELSTFCTIHSMYWHYDFACVCDFQGDLKLNVLRLHKR